MTNKLIFISIDNLRYDCVGFQQDKRELARRDVLKYLETPTLDRIAEKSLCFTQCISTSTYTTASHASILTGLYPPRNGVRAFFDTKLGKETTTLAEAVREQGFRTVLYTDIPDLFHPLDLHRGFEFSLSRDEDTLCNLLKDLGGDRIFLFAHFFDVHEPFLHNTNDFRPESNEDYLDEVRKLYGLCNMPGLYDRRGDRVDLWNRLVRGPLSDRPADALLPLYVRGVTKFDKGRFRFFLEKLVGIGLLENSLMAVFSDHGEGRCSRANKGYLSHGGELYDNVLRVPLMLTHPDIRPGTDNKLMSTVDIAPTVLSVLNIDSPDDTDGMDILSGERETSYAEFWGGAGGAVYATSAGRIKTDTGRWPEFLLTQMALRTNREKFIMRNRGEVDGPVSEAAFGLPNEDFVKRLYRNLFGRAAEPEGLKYHVGLLNSGVKTKRELLEDLLNSDEYRSTPTYALYDLEGDREEDFPLDPFSHAKAPLYLDRIKSISSQSVESEKIFKAVCDTGFPAKETTPDETVKAKTVEEERLIKRLRDLGYL